jgi:excisionase family DNA binding protein
MQDNATTLPSGQAMTVSAPKNPMGYTVAEVAQILGKHPNTIYAWTRNGRPLAAARQIGSTFYIPRRAVLSLLDISSETPDLVTANDGEAP